MKELIEKLWVDREAQDWKRVTEYFAEDAEILWPNTREKFTIAEFIRAYTVYPKTWSVEMERLERSGDTVISVVRAQLVGGSIAMHVTSFYTFEDGLVRRLVEYFSMDGDPPAWRRKHKVGERTS